MSEIRANESQLTLNRLFFDECVYICNKDDIEKTRFEIDFTREITRQGKHDYRVSVRCNATDETGEIKMHVRVVGLFSFTGDDQRKEKAMVSQNTMAILFPYLRNQITLMTAQIDGPKFSLPVMNIAEMFPIVDLPELQEK